MTSAIVIIGFVYGLIALIFHAIGVVTTDPRVRNRPLSILASLFWVFTMLVVIVSVVLARLSTPRDQATC
jgi:hypothetical protein